MQTSQLLTAGEVEVRQPEWGRWATASSLMLLLMLSVDLRSECRAAVPGPAQAMGESIPKGIALAGVAEGE